jgi:hypothetical protein
MTVYTETEQPQTLAYRLSTKQQAEEERTYGPFKDIQFSTASRMLATMTIMLGLEGDEDIHDREVTMRVDPLIYARMAQIQKVGNVSITVYEPGAHEPLQTYSFAQSS